ncbi:restriction endonuclease subunit S [Bifidobacterium longum subsp. longum]|uniref:restriction endonuclease subunit S n=2 Tax=Bifidobacterium TaxID=1678 RepID=UPI003DA65599
MTEQAKVPAIRFAGFTDPWEQRELVDIAEIVGGGTPDTNNSNYWDGDIDWYAPAELGNNIYAESSTRKITQAGFDSCSTKMLPADKTILFTSRAGIGNTAILRHSACTNQGFQSLVIGDADVYFVYSMSERIKKWAEEKASGSTFLEISGRQLETMPVNLPSLVEQQAIGSFFSHLDDLITLHQRKYDKLVIFKKSMLEKMFPKDGESVPEIRFAGFTDPWEQRKLGELFEESDERASDREILSVSVANGIYPASESDRETNPGASLANYKIVHFGDVVYNSMRMWQGAVDASRYDGIVSPAYVVARPNSEVYARFFARLLRQPMLLKQYQQVSQGNSKDTQVLKFDDFASIGISMPASENEQRRIGGFFDRLDSLITLHQRKLELLQNIKKSLLDKMFA